MSNNSADEAVREAEAALEARHDSPAAALISATELVQRPGISETARLVGLWAVGLAERELSSLVEAEAHLREAIDLGQRIPDPIRVAKVRSALVPILAARGLLDEARMLAEDVRGQLPASERADLDMKRALVFEQLGQLDAALAAYDDALRGLPAGDDLILEARLRCNRGIVLAFKGDTDQAMADSEIAEQLAIQSGQFLLAGGAANNCAFVAGRQGKIVEALVSFARAEKHYSMVGFPGRSRGVLASDRCEVMIAAGLYDEARSNAELAVRSLEEIDDVSDLAEARLLLARACFAQGDFHMAYESAMTADQEFRQAGRSGWAAMAQYLIVTAAHGASASEATQFAPEVLRSVDQIASDLETLGWTAESVSVRVAAAEIAITSGDRRLAKSQLDAAARSRQTGSPDRRAAAWLATALLRQSTGNRGGAKRAVNAGLRILAEQQTTLGATDLRVGATAHASRLASLGMRMALETRRPRDVLACAERVRSNTLAIPSVRPPTDSPLASALTTLRGARAELDDARKAGHAGHSLESKVKQQEVIVRDLARVVHGNSARPSGFSIDRLDEKLGDGFQLVEYVEMDGQISAVVAGNRRYRFHSLAKMTAVQSAIDLAVFSLTRMARPGGSEGSYAASAESLHDSLSQLDALLIQPLHLDSAALVVVPTGALHNVPWSGLPGLTNNPVSIAPSSTRWTPPAERAAPDAHVAIATGPFLTAVGREATAVQLSYRSSDQLTGTEATVSATLELLEHSDIAHIAAHGNFRKESPMFSSLTMADGELTVYDVEQLSAPPNIVVLPACHAAVSSISVGDELIGTASALLGVGVRSVIAPITVINDEASVFVMGCLHRYLSSGHSPSEALALTRRESAAKNDPFTMAVSAALVCLE